MVASQYIGLLERLLAFEDMYEQKLVWTRYSHELCQQPALGQYSNIYCRWEAFQLPVACGVQREQELGAKRASPALSPREELANRWSDNGGACPV